LQGLGTRAAVANELTTRITKLRGVTKRGTSFVNGEKSAEKKGQSGFRIGNRSNGV